nr:unnamed protein product [Spirometra erinaceieuropaei]
MFTLGHFYTVGNMSPYIMSYLRKYVEPHLKNSDAIWLSAASLASQGLAMPLSGLILLKTGFRIIVICSCILNSAGIFLSYLSIKTGFGCFLFTYAIMVGIGIGCCYGLLLSIAASWFPKHRGLIVGLCVCGFGAGAIVLTPVQTAIINPENIRVNNQTQMFEDEAVLQRIPTALLIIGGILASMQLIGCLTVRPRPNKPSPPPDEPNTTSEGKRANIVATVSAVCNTLSRIGWGPVGDRLSFKLPLCINNLFYCVVLITFPFVSAAPVAGRYLYAIWTIFMFICIGGNFVLLPFGISRAFGHKYFATNYGMVFTAFTPGSIIAAVIVSLVTLEHHTVGIFVGCGCIIFVVDLLVLVLVDEQAPSCLRRISRRRREIDNDEIQVTDAEIYDKQTIM